MEYLTSEEIAQKWDISSRRVTTLCKDGRIARSEEHTSELQSQR